MPLVGVVHAAATLDDALLSDLDVNRFEAVAAQGARRPEPRRRRRPPPAPALRALLRRGLLFGSPGQGNYAAANAALDAMAAARRAAGRPAQAIAWGPWAEVGMAARLGEQALRRWEARGVVGLSPDEGRRALRHAIAGGEAQVAVLNLRWSSLLHHFSKHPVPPLLEALMSSEQRRSVVDRAEPSEGEDDRDFLAALGEVDVGLRTDALADEIRAQVLQVLGLDDGYPVDPTHGFTEIGMDSLMAVELANRLGATVRLPLPSTVAFEHPTLVALTAHLALLLAEVLAPESAGPVAILDRTVADEAGDLTEAELAELAALTEAEITQFAPLAEDLEQRPFAPRVRGGPSVTAASPDDLRAIGDALAAIAPRPVRTGCRPITHADESTLHDVEAASVAGAVPRRRQEFAAGRALLRELLGVDRALPVGADRAPQLPAGSVGSLAHCEGVAVAAVAPDDHMAALGIDVEPATPLAPEVARVILRADDPDLDPHLAFAMKEAVYKAWSRLGGGMLDHHDVPSLRRARPSVHRTGSGRRRLACRAVGRGRRPLARAGPRPRPQH